MSNTAIYARVSTQVQEKDNTIHSQVEKLRKHAKEHHLHFDERDCFLDEGYSGGVLIRPALDKVRDAIAEGAYDTLLIYDPDRLARSYVHQMVLLEEINANGCRVEFIRNPIGDSPDEQLLLQMQGMIAEYERAKIQERTRRGKLHRMRNGEIVNGRKIFGYEYIKKTSTAPARYEIIEEEAKVVKTIFEWFVCEKLTLREIGIRLNEQGIDSPRGGRWQGPNIGNHLKNSIYTGTGYANRFKAVEPKRRGAVQDKYYKYAKTTMEKRPEEEWFAFDAPRIISDEQFELAQRQLERNRRLSARRTKNEYLLRGIVKCGECGLSMFSQKGRYQCPYSRPAYAAEHEREVCVNKQRISTEELDKRIWEEVYKLLKSRRRLRQIHQQLRKKASPTATGDGGALSKKREKLSSQANRINDLYILGAIDKKDHQEKHSTIQSKLKVVDRQLSSLKHNTLEEEEIEKMLTSFNKFTDAIKKELESANFATKRHAVEEIVKSVEIKKDEIILNYAVPLKRKKGTLSMLTHDYSLIWSSSPRVYSLPC